MRATADNKPFAVVTGLEFMQGIQAARILSKRHHLPVIAVSTNKNHPYNLTNCCHQVVCTDNNLIEDLIAIGRQLAQKAVLYPGSDADVLLVSRN